MSQESEKTGSQTEAEPAEQAADASATTPKKKRGFWGWLTGGSEPEEAPPAEAEAATAAPAEDLAPAGPGEAAPEAPPALPEPGVEAEPITESRPAAEVPEAAATPEAPAEEVAAPLTTPAAEPAVDAPKAEQPTITGAISAEPEASEAAVPETASAAEEPEATASEGSIAAEPGEVPAETPPAEAELEGASPEPVASAIQEPKKGFWSRLVSGLARTAGGLTQGITDLVTKRKLDEETLEELEDLLIRADLGTDTALRIVAAVAKGRHDKMISPEEVKALIATEVETILAPVAEPLVIDTAHKPFVVLMVGVNGSGKTTTIGKLAAQWRAEGHKVVLAAGDTFRAAAIEQLKVWGARTGATVIARESGADAAGVAFDAYATAKAEGADILMIDTAGRLQNRAELMAELEKVVRVIKKQEPTAPHAVLLVLDATVGQNALSQVEAFHRTAGVTGLVMTKLDGTARGGILVAIAARYHMPIHLIGVGEGAEDLQPFTARDFARAIAGLA